MQEIAELCSENKRLQAQLECLDSVGATPKGHHLMLHHSTTGAASSASGGGGPPQRQDAVDGAIMSYDGLLGGTSSSSYRKTSSTLKTQQAHQHRARADGAVPHAPCHQITTQPRQGQSCVDHHATPFKGDGSSDSSSDTSEEAITISESDRSGSEGGNGSSTSSSAGGDGSRGKSSGEE